MQLLCFLAAFNIFAMKFTILILSVLAILHSISIHSLDLPLHSLPPFGTELNDSVSLAVGGVGWKRHSQGCQPGCSSAAKLPLWHGQQERQAGSMRLRKEN